MYLYYAVNASGQGVVFTDKPVRDSHRKCWQGTIIACLAITVGMMEAYGEIELPVLKWNDEPVEIELNLSLC